LHVKEGMEVVVEDCVFSGATDRAVIVEGGTLTLNNSDIINGNSVSAGTGLFVSDGFVTLNSVNISNNISESYGSAIYVTGENNSITIDGDTNIENNTSFIGSIYLDNDNAGTSEINFKDGRISGHTAVSVESHEIYGINFKGILNFYDFEFVDKKEDFVESVVCDGATINKQIELNAYLDDEIYDVKKTLDNEEFTAEIFDITLEDCCGWFGNEELTKAYKTEKLLSNLYPNEVINIYTRTATPEKLEFVLNEEGSSYIIRQSDNLQNSLVMPAKHNGLDISGIVDADLSENGAFYLCNSLKEVVLNINVNKIPNCAFSNCSALEKINLTENIESIGFESFLGCVKLTNISLFESLHTISERAFTNAGLLSVIIPENVTTIGDSAFNSCPMISIEYRAKNIISYPSYTAFFNVGNTGDGVSVLVGKEVETIPPYFLGVPGSYSPNVKTVVFEEESICKIISNHAFNNCKSLESIAFTSNITKICDRAFFGCENLNYITVSESLTEIGSFAFYKCYKLTEIWIPQLVNIIGPSAFSECRAVTTINFDAINLNNLSINNQVFYYTGYTSKIDLNIGSGVTKIPNYLFDAGHVRSINFSETSILKSIGDYAFRGNKSIINLIIPEGVTTIGSAAFDGCNLISNLKFPSTLTTIGNTTFQGCSSISSLTIPENVTQIGTYAFRNCTNISLINFNAANVEYFAINNFTFANVGYNTDGIILNIGSNVINIPDRLFCPYTVAGYSPNIVSINFSDNSVCETIGESAFGFCSDLNNFILPESLTTIEISAFEECNSVSLLYIPKNVNSIGDRAFSGCGLESIEVDNDNIYFTDYDSDAIVRLSDKALIVGCKNTIIPEDIITIESYAFFKSDLKSLYIPVNVNTIKSNAFANCKNLESITVDDNNSVFADYDSNAIINKNNYFLVLGCKETIIPSVVRVIGGNAFEGSGIVQIDIPNNVTTILNSAFVGCQFLEKVILPNTLASISAYTFANCDSLESIIIPDTVESINSYAFSSCTNLTSITLSSNLKTIGVGAFHKCRALTSIELPSTLTEINNQAFSFCTAMTSIYLPASIQTIISASSGQSIFNNSNISMQVYCEMNEKPSGWGEYWNYYSNTEYYIDSDENGNGNIHWGVTREEYNQLLA